MEYDDDHLTNQLFTNCINLNNDKIIQDYVSYSFQDDDKDNSILLSKYKGNTQFLFYF